MRYAADVRKIWYCKLWERPYYYVIPHLAVAALLYSTLGFVGMLWCLYVPMLVVYNFTWAVNSICHMPSFRLSDVRDLRPEQEQLLGGTGGLWRGVP